MADRYHVTGTYFEGCNCGTPCPCGDKCPTNKCHMAVGWHIDHGHVGDVELSGLNVIAAYMSPGTPMDGNWQAKLYVDEKANAAQRTAVSQIFSGRLGGQPALFRQFAGHVQDVQYVSIKFSEAGGRKTLQIPEVLNNDLIAGIVGQIAEGTQGPFTLRQ